MANNQSSFFLTQALRKVLLASFAVAILVVLVDCTPPGRKYRQSRSKTYAKGKSSGKRYRKPPIPGGTRGRIIREAYRYLGVRYRYGGTTPNGFDCSGLVGYVYKKAARIRLPRTSGNQSRVGKRVRRPLPGDLLFFRTLGKRISHVGIYLGRGLFLHAPGTGKYVRVDQVKNGHWRKHYAFSRAYVRR